MSRFKIRFKLQGLEMEIEGNRDDIPLITENVAHQVAGLIKPASNIVEGELVLEESGSDNNKAEHATKKTRKRRVPASSASPVSAKEEPVEFVHDSSKFGAPRQNWTTAQKALWLLYVVSKVSDIKELSAPRVTNTFNQHFRQAGLIRGNNVSRDFGNYKLASPALIGENTNKRPSTWFLTDAGIQSAQALVTEATGRS